MQRVQKLPVLSHETALEAKSFDWRVRFRVERIPGNRT